MAGDLDVRPIGWVRSPLHDRTAAPKQGTEGAPPSTIELEDDVLDAARDLQPDSEVWVLTWLDRADRSVLRTHPRDDQMAPELGIFSTRSPDRPNPIGLHRVQLLTISDDGRRLAVADLEAIDGTPVLDLKPVLPGE